MNKMFVDPALTQTGIINATFGLSTHSILQNSQIPPTINSHLDPFLYNLAFQPHPQCNENNFNLLTSLFQQQSCPR
jgi:hypothetical protein